MTGSSSGSMKQLNLVDTAFFAIFWGSFLEIELSGRFVIVVEVMLGLLLVCSTLGSRARIVFWCSTEVCHCG